MVGRRDPLRHLSREAVVPKMNGVHCEAEVRAPNAKDKVDRREREFTGLSMVVRYVSAPDAEIRIDRAITILLAAVEEYAKLSKEIANPEEDPPRQKHADDVGRIEGGAIEDNRVRKGRHD